MSQPDAASSGHRGGHDPIPDSGAAVLRYRTRSDAAMSGHALLIGSPLDELGGVGDCLRGLASWLAPTHELVEGPMSPTKANIEAQVQQLRTSVNTGDQALVYYAGHGLQGLPDPMVHDRPTMALLPIDARHSTLDDPRLIPGDVLVRWLNELADACGVPEPAPHHHASQTDEVLPSVTLVLECCHSGGAMDDWPDAAADYEAVVRFMGRVLEGRNVRGGLDPLPRVVRVMASGRDEWAQGAHGQRRWG